MILPKATQKSEKKFKSKVFQIKLEIILKMEYKCITFQKYNIESSTMDIAIE